MTGAARGIGEAIAEAFVAEGAAVVLSDIDGVFLGCKHALPLMRRRGSGSIINISSRSGLVGIPAANPS